MPASTSIMMPTSLEGVFIDDVQILLPGLFQLEFAGEVGLQTKAFGVGPDLNLKLHPGIKPSALSKTG